MKPYAKWQAVEYYTATNKIIHIRHDLVVGRGRKSRIVAQVWPNGTWHTFDPHGTSGENSREQTPRLAKIEAAASAIEQGFI